MASACVNSIGMATESLIDRPCTSYGWLSPKISLSRDVKDDKKPCNSKEPTKSNIRDVSDEMRMTDLEISDKELFDFEFHLEDSTTMLTADELFLNGKLVPLQISTARSSSGLKIIDEIRAHGDTSKSEKTTENPVSEPCVISPKPPSCTSSWRELLRLRRKSELQKVSTFPTKNHNPRFLNYFLQRTSKSSSSDSSLNFPLLKDCDSDAPDPLPVSSRFSLSLPSSSDRDQHDLPRLSLDSKRLNSYPPRVRVSKPRILATEESRISSGARNGRSQRRSLDSGRISMRSLSVDSPRMNSSGKVIFQNLGRSSSSPSSFNGGSKNNNKHRAGERNYSANLFTPVLNVPVCSIRGSSKSGGSIFGFSQLFPPQKKELSSNRVHIKNRSERN